MHYVGPKLDAVEISLNASTLNITEMKSFSFLCTTFVQNTMRSMFYCDPYNATRMHHNYKALNALDVLT